ncbi:leucyl aminopeptidase [Microbacterium sp. SYP-A9085]|uniref:leucyl aminopeptidase n=1 Tax=Microbacterium sp. SYP-A9085 TaxID=2664454 RepID=UPI00129C0E5C|nr:leucyl aminopeptidase [Microbacterium sp. SYP-A9085]MRH29798.1 leucyl aminopeptidase [Microbacterium sp. SYP-A9085]
MPFPTLEHSSSSIRDSDADVLILALPPTDDPPAEIDGFPGLAAALTVIGFTGTAGSVHRVSVGDLPGRAIAVVGTGAEPTADAVRDAVGAALRTLTGFAHAAVAVPGADAATQRAAAEGAMLGGYWFDDYKTGEDRKRPAGAVTVHGADLTDADVEWITQAAASVALVKDLTTTPAQWLGPQDLAQRAVDAVAGLPVDVTVLDETQLAEGGYGGIIGVGQGSARPPRLVRLEYAPAAADRHVALVGKGITFDTGGLSLKPAASMVGMKGDMAGAATVLAVIRAAAALSLPVRVTAWMCIADNMPSGSAIRPGDVLRTLGGTSVEVLNTDAEGRLVLADGLVAASRENPDVIIDVATLTGAISVALGTRHTGVMGDEEAVSEFLDAAQRTGELAWPLPLPAHMEKELDSSIADVQNAKIGDRSGGSLFAGLFLQRFVGRRDDRTDAPRLPWVHLDIAGSGENPGAPYGFTDKGPTGSTVRALITFLQGAEQR